jgi:hypothetical protein
MWILSDCGIENVVIFLKLTFNKNLGYQLVFKFTTKIKSDLLFIIF